ncbi:MAG: DNA polymerase III subunit delta' C-terminal domain-containing protein [Dehalococcoidales bacterium]
MWSIVGQSRAVSLFERGLETGSLAHAYLFSGPAHVGKMTLAVNLAQALNCQADEPPCGQCGSCKKITGGRHADIRVVGLDNSDDSPEARQRAEISIDQIRDIQRSASLPPFEGSHRVYIIDRAELLSLEAANCLLKTLEEPNERVLFILLTTNDRLLPETVISRCQTVRLTPAPLPQVEAALIENWNVDSEKAGLLARLSHGCLGWAVSAADDDSIFQQRAEWLDKLVDIISADSEERFAYAAQLATQFGRNRGQVQEKLDLWLDWWRDLLLVKAGSSDNVTNIDRKDLISEMSENYSLARIRGFIKNILEAGEQLRRNANARLVLEVLMLDIPELKKSGGVKSAV